MPSLRLVALSADGSSLVLAPEGSSDPGERFEVPIDDRLRAAVRGERPAEQAPDTASALSPREIQARIRAGESPEQVAHSSGTSVERIMRFAHPVLQERERVAEQAREAQVQLSDSVLEVPLEQFMSQRLRLLGTDLDAVRWDAHRTDDGSWLVRAAWRAGHKSGTTRWRFDLRTRTVATADAATLDFAEGTRLVRVVPHVPAGAPGGPVVTELRRSSPAADDEDGEPVEPSDDDLPDDDLPDDEPADGGVRTEPADVLLSGDGIPDEIAAQPTVVLSELLAEGEPLDEDEDPRAQIPAWEDIVFGVRRRP